MIDLTPLCALLALPLQHAASLHERNVSSHHQRGFGTPTAHADDLMLHTSRHQNDADNTNAAGSTIGKAGGEAPVSGSATTPRDECTEEPDPSDTLPQPNAPRLLSAPFHPHTYEAPGGACKPQPQPQPLEPQLQEPQQLRAQLLLPKPQPHPVRLQLLLSAAQSHGVAGPAAGLHAAAVAAAAMDMLWASVYDTGGGDSGRSRSSSRDAPPPDIDSDIGFESAVVRAAAGWLADVAADPTATEPAARAALAGLADLIPLALRLLRPPGPAQSAGCAAVRTGHRMGTQEPVGAEAGGGAGAAAAAVLYEPRCSALRLAAASTMVLYGRCADAAAVAAAARMLGSCLQLQLRLAWQLSLQPWPPPGSRATGAGSSWPSWTCTKATAEELPYGCPTGLSGLYGWDALLQLGRHPHPRVRSASMCALQQGCEAAAYDVQGSSRPLDAAAAAAAYGTAVAALDDDAEEPRAAAISLVSVLAGLVPELLYGTHFGVAARLVDDAFMRLCGCVADPQRGLRLQALRALGGLHAASLRVKLQALSKKTTLRVAAPAPTPAAATAPAPHSAPVASAAAEGVGGTWKGAGGKRAAAAAAAAAGPGGGSGGSAGPSSEAKRLTTSAWEPQSWSWVAQAAAGPGAVTRSGPGSRNGPGSGSGVFGSGRHGGGGGRGGSVGRDAGRGVGGGGGGGGRSSESSDDLTLLENAVGAFVLASEDEHWEVRAAALRTMTRLAEHEYTAAVAAVAAAAGAAGAAAGVESGGAGVGNGSGGGGGGMMGQPPAAKAAAAVNALSVRIGGIGGTAGSRIAAGGGNAEAAAAICDALVDALLDELPEVRQAAAEGVLRLLKLEEKARRQQRQPQAAAAPAPAAQQQPLRRTLPPLLTEEGVRALVTAARDTDGITRRAVVAALGCLRLARPGLLREVVQALRRCVATNPTAADWRAVSRTAWKLGAAAPEAAAASVRDLSPTPQDLPASVLLTPPQPQPRPPSPTPPAAAAATTAPCADTAVAAPALAGVASTACMSDVSIMGAAGAVDTMTAGSAPPPPPPPPQQQQHHHHQYTQQQGQQPQQQLPTAHVSKGGGGDNGCRDSVGSVGVPGHGGVTAGAGEGAEDALQVMRQAAGQVGSDAALRLLVLAGALREHPAAVGAALPGHVSLALLRAVQDLYGPPLRGGVR